MPMQSIRIALISILVASAVGFRIVKHTLAGPIQFINLPLVFTIVSGSILGFKAGFTVGSLSFLISDMFLGAGLWTVVDGFMAGLIGGIAGLLWNGRKPEFPQILTISYILAFTYDIATSFILYVLMSIDVRTALLAGFLGLFMPVMGGFLYAVGPITEFLSAFTASLLLLHIRRVKI